ncbi:MAG TPA: hypothetical protein VMF90_06015 [Rhizobiaceae bacterium]|nr:hypothetical protein [Rhizobiaceae bacterium]
MHEHPFHRAEQHARRHLGSFPGERASRCRGFNEPSTPAKDTSSLLAVIVSCVGVFAACIAMAALA